MRCMACGSESAPGAKFCAACGKPMAPEAPPGTQQPPAHPVGQHPGQHQHPVNVQVHVNMGHGGQSPHGYPNGDPLLGQLQGRMDMMRAPAAGMIPFGQQSWVGPRRARGRYCVSCEQRTIPVPYFSRGVNVAKAVVLFPFTPFAPLIFFLIKRSRAICSYCHSSLPGEMNIPLLETFSAEGMHALGPMEPGEELATMASKASGQEIALLERRSRKQRRRAWVLGAITAGMASIGAANAIDGDEEAGVILFGISGLAGAGALVNRQRGQQNNVLAAAARQRQRVQEILSIARAHAGKLNVTMVASQLHLDFREAEALLDGMVDGRRVDVEVDDQGRMNYVFPELKP